MNDKPLILLVGKSGSGKTTIAKHLEDHYGMKMLESYTTRKPRYEGERGHEFVTHEFYMKPSNKVAHTYFDGNHYWATQEQCDASDVYIIDPDGVITFERNYHSHRRYVVIYLKINPITRFIRMVKRDRSIKKAFGRILHDHKKFGDFESHPDIWVVGNNTVEHTAKALFQARDYL